MKVEFPSALRAQITEAFVQCGASLTDANLATDLAIHAVDEAMATVLRVAARAPNPVIESSVLSLAAQLLVVAADSAAKSILGIVASTGTCNMVNIIPVD